MAKAVTEDDLRAGRVVRIRPSQLGKLSQESDSTIGRKIRSGIIQAEIDPVTKRIFISAEVALAYLGGTQPYKHDFTNSENLMRMEHARSAKAARASK